MINLNLMEIKEKTNLPLVLHGGSGIPDELIKKSVTCGICKLNINTDFYRSKLDKLAVG